MPVAQRGQQKLTTIPLEVSLNHPYLPLRVNASAWCWSILDSGATAILIDDVTAASIGLESRAAGATTGTGPLPLPIAFAQDVSLRLPGLDVLFRQVVVAPINAMLSPYAGRAVNGILGYDFLSRYVVEVDYAGRQVHLYDPDSYHYTGPYEPLPLSLINQHPHLKGVLTLPDGSSIEADFILDSGAAPALLLATPFVEAHGLLSSGLVAVPELAAGVGGAAPVMVGRMPALGFGPWRFENLTTYFSQSKGDAIAELLQADGIIGGQILRRYRVIWDYPHEQVILEPQLPGRSLKETAISGMLLKLAGTDYRRFMVDGIAPGSPAAEAGLLAGDRLLSVNDQWTLGLELDELYRCFTGGRRHRLLIERSQTHLARILDLRRQP